MNTKKYLLSRTAFAFFYVISAGMVFAEEESLALDPRSGNYVITYRSSENPNEFQQATFIPATKIDPVVRSRFRLLHSGQIQYDYDLKNGRSARQPLAGLDLVASHAFIDGQTAPRGWRGTGVVNPAGAGFRVGWTYEKLKEDGGAGLLPGQTQPGFEFESADLPGLGIARLDGATPLQGFPDAGPDPASPVGKQFLQLQTNDFVTRAVAVPKIPIPSPFDAAALLNSIRVHVKTDMVALDAVEPAFADQLDRLFGAAIEAARLGNARGLNQHVNELRRMLVKAHPDIDDKDENDRDHERTDSRIDRLAARVLNFDLKYLRQRLQGEAGEGAREKS